MAGHGGVHSVSAMKQKPGENYNITELYVQYA
jgi:hypothetical protein